MQWLDTTASMLLFNSNQDYESVMRLLPQTVTGTHHTGHSKFLVNNPELESGVVGIFVDLQDIWSYSTFPSLLYWMAGMGSRRELQLWKD